MLTAAARFPLILIASASLFLLSGLTASSAFAASYLRTDGSVVDPILYTFFDPHPYSGPNLEPFAILTGADLRQANLASADLQGTNLDGANLFAAELTDANLTGTSFASTNLRFGDLRGSSTAGANFFQSDLLMANLARSDWTGVNFSQAVLQSASLDNSNLTMANFSGANLSFARFYFSNLDRADLTGADMSSMNLLNSTSGSPFYDVNTDFTGTGFDPVAAGWSFVPEPSTALLMGIGLSGLAARRRVGNRKNGASGFRVG